MLLRRVARPLLAAVFVSGGVNELLNASSHAEMVKPLLDKGQEALPTEQNVDNLTVVQVDAAVKVGAGLLLALGWMPRLAAAALSASLIPTTVGAHAFWELEGADRADQQIHFFKNAGLLGGLMLAAADTEGKPSLAWRARKAKKDAARASKQARKNAGARVDSIIH